MRTELMPDTIFLPDRARLAINCLTGCLDPGKDFLPYCLMDLTGSPPRMAHTQFDYSDHTARVIDALLLARALSGSQDGAKELEALETLLFKGFGEDGLHYTPDNPWSFRHANMHYQRSVINGLLSLALAKGSEPARQRLAGLAKALMEVSIKREGFAYFPAVERLPDGWPRGDWNILSFGVDPANTNGRLLFGLTRAWELSGDHNARDLAGAYARHVMDHSSAYLPDGSFATGMEFREGHFHSRAVTMLGVIRYGHGFGDARAVAWGRRVFEAARRAGTSFGWFPERLVRSRAHGCETCAIVDMMEAAIWLARSGYPEYWETAEGYLRNQLLESQVTSIEGLEDGAGTGADPEWETTHRVARRSLGGFAGWSQPNDLFSKVMHAWDLYTCCCAQGVRGLFNAWTNAVSAGDGETRVHLLLNHIGRHATVKSWLPHEGRLEVTPRNSGDVLVRLPSWVDHRAFDARVGGAKVVASFLTPQFARIVGVAAGTTIAVGFPVRERSLREVVLDIEYTTHWRGDTVVHIAPEGERSPLYRHRLSPSGAIAMVEKSVPEIAFNL